MKKSLIFAVGTVSSREVKPSSASNINGVHGMLDRYAPHVVFGMNNYGCSGDNYLDVNMPVKGLPVDSVDNLIIAWKECIHNASRAEKGRRSTRQASHNSTHHHEMSIVDRPKYQFNDRQHRCISSENSFEQEVCECDLEFAENISEEYVDDSKVDYPTKKCSHGSSLEPKKIRSALFADELSLTRL